jgi:HSP20 family protein
MNRLLLTNPRLVRSFGNLATEVESMMDRFFGEHPDERGLAGQGNGLSTFTPRLDAAETETAFEISVDLPGVKPEDVHVELSDDRLTISGKRESVQETKDKQYHRIERSSGSFTRSMVLPAPVDQEKIEASYDGGVLHVTLPKAAVGSPKRIQVKTAGTDK